MLLRTLLLFHLATLARASPSSSSPPTPSPTLASSSTSSAPVRPPTRPRVTEAPWLAARRLASATTAWPNVNASGNVTLCVGPNDTLVNCTGAGGGGLFGALGLSGPGAAVVGHLGSAYVGFMLQFYGGETKEALLLCQSLTTAMSPVVTKVSAMKGFDPIALKNIGQGVMSAVTLSMATLGNPGLGSAMMGASLGQAVIGPVLASVEPFLRDKVSRCKKKGEPTEQFPNGAWEDCDERVKGKAMWAFNLVNWALVGGSVGLGFALAAVITCMSSAMMGAELVAAAITGLILVGIEQALGPAIAEAAEPTLKVITVPLVYALGGLGLLFQLIVKAKVAAMSTVDGEDKKDGDEKEESKKEGGEGTGDDAEAGGADGEGGAAKKPKLTGTALLKAKGGHGKCFGIMLKLSLLAFPLFFVQAKVKELKAKKKKKDEEGEGDDSSKKDKKGGKGGCLAKIKAKLKRHKNTAVHPASEGKSKETKQGGREAKTGGKEAKTGGKEAKTGGKEAKSGGKD